MQATLCFDIYYEMHNCILDSLRFYFIRLNKTTYLSFKIKLVVVGAVYWILFQEGETVLPEFWVKKHEV